MRQELIDYIKKEIKKGFSLGAIKQALLKAGYESKTVEEHLQIFRREKKKRLFLNIILTIIFIMIIYSSLSLYSTIKNQKASQIFLKTNPADIDKALNKGRTLLYQKDYANAIREFDKIIELNPDEYNAYDGLASSYYELMDFSNAIKYYNNSLSINHKNAYAQAGIINSYIHSGDYDIAIQIANDSLGYFPDKGFLYDKLALSYFMKNDINKSIYFYQKSLERTSKKDFYQFGLRNAGLGLAYLRNKEYGKALSYLETSSNAANLRIYRSLAATYFFMGDEKKSEDLLKISLEKNNVSAIYDYLELHALALIYLEHKIYDRAIIYLQKAIELNPNNHALYKDLGKVYLELKDYDNAVINFEKAIAIKNNDNETLNLLYKAKNLKSSTD